MSSPFPHTFTPYFHVAGANPATEGALLPGRHRLRGDGHRKFPAGQQRAAATGREEPGTGHGPRGATGGHKDLFNTAQMGCVFIFFMPCFPTEIWMK